jgi:hypothetical protein
LRLGIESPGVSRVWAAVNVHDQRQVAPLQTGRAREVAVQGESVARGDLDRFHRRQRVRRQIRLAVKEKPALLRGAVVGEKRGGPVVGRERHDPRPVRVIAAADREIPVVEAADRVEVFADRLVQHRPFGARAVECHRLISYVSG